MKDMPRDISRLSQEALMALVKALPVAALYIEGDTIYFNRAAERLTGYERAEIPSVEDWFLKLYGPDHEAVRRYYEADRAAGFPEPRRVAITAKDGCRRHVEFTAAGSERVICIMHDITDLIVAQVQLRQSEERHRHFSALSSDYVNFCTRQGDSPYRVQWLGGAFEAITGYTEQDLYEWGCWMHLTHPDDRERVNASITSMMPGDTRTEEFRLIARDGSTHWIRQACRCEAGTSPGELYLFGTSRDITVRQQAEDAIRQLNEELDQRVADRTAQLETAIREQESFSYSVSHDLRAPLRHINSYSAIITEEFGNHLPAEALPYLDRIVKASARMGQLIDDLLELSRVGRVELHHKTVNLSRMATRIATMLRETKPDRTVEWVIADDIKARGDSTLLRQLLENLLVNAWKYTVREPRARIEFGKTLVEGVETFFVKDNGVGFDMAYGDKLYHPFQRLHGNEFEGTGIGLATVKRIVERHRGKVWAEGHVNEGATFYFTLSEACNDEALPGSRP